MFYTKYRPQNFSEIAKPNDAAAALMTQVKNDKVAHAYLFVGPRGTGKTTTARILAKALNCTDLSKEGDPCGKCENCVAIKKSSFMDLIEIDAASNRGIDDIRDLRDRIKLAPSLGKSKVYIIDEVHMLTQEAFNALLKTLEEPPPHAHFVLCTTESHKVPETIKSRCQTFKFKRATIEQIVGKLEAISKQEGAKLKKEELEKIAQASYGGFRDAETILQQVIEGNMDPASFAGLSSHDIYAEFVNALIDKDAGSALRQINKIADEGFDLNVWVLELLQYLRGLLFVSAGADEGILDTTGNQLKEMKEISQKVSTDDLLFFTETFMEAGNKVMESSIQQLPLEVAIVKITGSHDQKKTKETVKTEIKVTKTERTEKQKPDGKEITVEKEEVVQETEELIEDEDLEEEVEESGEKTQVPAADIEEIQTKWENIIKGTVSYNHSINALLKACQPLRVDGNTLVLEVYYAFHKERIEAPKNREVIEGVVNEITGTELQLKCEVNTANRPKKKKGSKETGELTDYNVIPAMLNGAAEEGDVNVADMFDGGLPL